MSMRVRVSILTVKKKINYNRMKRVIKHRFTPKYVNNMFMGEFHTHL